MKHDKGERVETDGILIIPKSMCHLSRAKIMKWVKKQKEKGRDVDVELNKIRKKGEKKTER